ncbi:methylated-DNA-protein-cysteine methyltransferase [Nonlabens tegetincola]|uniref:Methylated-DNA-protein-cysteine methyltransferase n=1 Tax=Nonlabens tegetincola TaxID=323273 RepID=A0A090QRK8_9FLAO|nr:methylated-DNA--[protein]-cysteine S-methyltransferase [Nonlabens tegetincola]GAK98121.1 methylated-DNA-protein-cysteine methyltransferase [Nonlabens tegetincola]
MEYITGPRIRRGYFLWCAFAKRNQQKAIRAVAAANGANALSIIVPCHRVVGADGSLTGYAGGLKAKRYLIDLERKNSDTGQMKLFI